MLRQLGVLMPLETYLGVGAGAGVVVEMLGDGWDDTVGDGWYWC